MVDVADSLRVKGWTRKSWCHSNGPTPRRPICSNGFSGAQRYGRALSEIFFQLSVEVPFLD